MLSEYLHPDSTKEVSNRDIVSISALASKYLETYNKNEHPISTLALLENEIIDSDDTVEMNANIAMFDVSDDQNDTVGGDNNMTSHKNFINEVTNEFNDMDPYKAGIFQSSINYVSEFQEGEESLEDKTTSSNGTMFDDAVSETNKEMVKGVNSLSNTEEMYILFGQADVSTINNFDIETKADMECCWLDPHIASGVARMPENVINLLDSDSEEEDRCGKSEVQVNAKRDADDEDMRLHPLDELLSLKRMNYNTNK